MTAGHLFSLFWSLPLVVQSWIVLVLLLLADSVWTNSRRAGRAAAWVDERRIVPRALRVARRPSEWRVRVARRAPQWLIDRRAARLLAQMESSGADIEEADHGRGR